MAGALLIVRYAVLLGPILLLYEIRGRILGNRRDSARPNTQECYFTLVPPLPRVVRGSEVEADTLPGTCIAQDLGEFVLNTLLRCTEPGSGWG